MVACEDLLSWQRDPDFPVDAEDRKYKVDQRRIAFRRESDDPISPRINAVVHEIEKLCQPAIEARVRRT
jgi:hypothetical protein